MNIPSNVNLDALRSFAVFAEHLNFSTAAAVLHISQPALHVKIRKLGEQLRLPLYLRVGRGLELTAYGQQVAQFAREMQERASEFVHQLHGEAQHRTVVLAAGDGAYLYLLGAGLREYIRRAQASVRLLTADRDAAIAAVESGKAQLGVAPLEATREGFESRVLTRVGQVLVMPRNHPLSARPEIRLGDLAESTLVVPPQGRPHRVMLARMLDSAGVRWHVGVEANGWELMIHFVGLGVGLAIVNACCRIPKGLVARPLPQLPRMQYHVFHLQGIARNGPAAELRAALLAHGSDWMTRHA